jgi:mRNA interferase RelE/StbE
MNLEIRKSAIRDLKKFDYKTRELLHSKIFELKNFPKVTNIKKLSNHEPAYRF